MSDRFAGAERSLIEEREERELAPWAIRSTQSRGRDHDSSPDQWRTAFQRDRDRIIHARAFRRLAYKTQVFTNNSGDLFRSRLTHTMEVSQIARTVAQRLRLNVDLVECVSLVHDLGHPPFGHRGEDILADLMVDYGGFEHNLHTLRVVEELEHRYPEYPGLNLTYEVRESIVKHSAHGDRSRVPQRFYPNEAPLLETSLVDEVDSITYDCHDIDDGIRAGIIDLDALAEVSLWRGALQQATEASAKNTSKKLLIDRAIRVLLDAFVGDLVETSSWRIEQHRIASLSDVRSHEGEQLIGLSPSMTQAKRDLEAWLFTHCYRDWRVNRTFHTAQQQLQDLFHFYVQHPDALPDEHQARINSSGLHRTVADYLAGMTDRFALDEHRQLFHGPKI